MSAEAPHTLGDLFSAIGGIAAAVAAWYSFQSSKTARAAALRSVAAAEESANATIRSANAAEKSVRAADRSAAAAVRSAQATMRSASAADRSATAAENSAEATTRSATAADRSATAAEKTTELAARQQKTRISIVKSELALDHMARLMAALAEVRRLVDTPLTDERTGQLSTALRSIKVHARILGFLDREHGQRMRAWLDHPGESDRRLEGVVRSAYGSALDEAGRKLIDERLNALHDLKDSLFESLTNDVPSTVARTARASGART